ncbi:proteasome assembly chaperone 4 [Impatiens glandulifera]|uniref:proteasome assembly chaperone 4 n=1 Tax=Impatiens glandulifera TaxID=253017 RepID=UPI001FB0DE68|nr:proteasome assembly chaperone 4 [Impatiens glandulifera]
MSILPENFDHSNNIHPIEFLTPGMKQLEVSPSSTSIESSNTSSNADGVQVTCFSEVIDGVSLHFQIIFLHKQIFAWVGCSSAKLGHLYAAAPTRPNNTVSMTSIIGGASDNTGSGIARRLVLKTGMNIILACNLPKNSPMLEASAEKLLKQKIMELGYTQNKSKVLVA